jgi:hypothetical protein
VTGPPEDLDFLAARTHARYALRAERLGLEALARHRTLEALWRAVLPAAEPSNARELQRRLALEWLDELEELARGLDAPRARLLDALCGRVGDEDRRTLVRGIAAQVPAAALQAELLRPQLAPRLDLLRSVEDVVPPSRPAPDPALLGRRHAAAFPPAALPRPYALELLLEQRRLQRLLAALGGLGHGDRTEVRAVVHQEVDQFHLGLVARCHFALGLPAEALLPWHVPGAAIDLPRLAAMLSAPTLATSATMARGRALDELPPPQQLDARALDRAAWRRYLRLASRTFRRGGMRFAALVGYAALRRVEVMDLGTISEGVRLLLPADVIGACTLAHAAEVLRA